MPRSREGTLFSVRGQWRIKLTLTLDGGVSARRTIRLKPGLSHHEAVERKRIWAERARTAVFMPFDGIFDEDDFEVVSHGRLSVFVISRPASGGYVDSDSAPDLYDGPGVYVVKASGKLVKIGKANCIRRRLAVLRTASSSRLKLLAIVSTDTSDEARIHARFDRFREFGEWFRYEGELKKFVEGFAK